MDDGEIDDALRFLVLEEREVMEDVFVRARRFFSSVFYSHHEVRKNLASTIQYTKKVAM